MDVTSLVSGGIRLPLAAARSRCIRRPESLGTESSAGEAEAAVNLDASQMDTGTRYVEATVATKRAQVQFDLGTAQVQAAVGVSCRIQIDSAELAGINGHLSVGCIVGGRTKVQHTRVRQSR